MKVIKQQLIEYWFSAWVVDGSHQKKKKLLRTQHAAAAAAAATAKSLQSCPTLCDPIDSSPPGSAIPPGKNAGVGCHFLLQWMKMKSESEVAQSFPTLSVPMDCSPSGSSVHGIFQAKVLEWVAIAFSSLSSQCGGSIPMIVLKMPVKLIPCKFLAFGLFKQICGNVLE